jgi:bifunctional UDP-N-acetylglucosamine pyrophosphorylase/glucosamine-1-phosphate N-acetyltransferase
MDGKITTGVILAGGKGTRLNNLPLTRVLQKCMLPILHKPILEYVLDNMKKMKIKKIFMLVSWKKEIIQEYFGDGKEFGVDIEYVDSTGTQGIAHAISLLKNKIKEPFVAFLGDDFTVANSLEKIIDVFFEKNAIVVEGVVNENKNELIKQTCSVMMDKNQKILKIVEKPESPPSKIRGCGIYVFSPEIFNFIEKTPLSPMRKQREITDTIDLASKVGRAYGFLIDGVNVNINTYDDLFLATEIALKNKL